MVSNELRTKTFKTSATFRQVSLKNTQSSVLSLVRQTTTRNFPFKLTTITFVAIQHLVGRQSTKIKGEKISLYLDLCSLICKKIGTGCKAYFNLGLLMFVLLPTAGLISPIISGHHENAMKKCSSDNSAWENPLAEYKVLYTAFGIEGYKLVVNNGIVMVTYGKEDKNHATISRSCFASKQMFTVSAPQGRLVRRIT